MNHKKPSSASIITKAHPDTSPENNSGLWDGDHVVIFSYSRAQAIEDGVLVDAGKLAEEAGFRYPVALTSTVWHACIEVPPTDLVHDEIGRLWDVLNVLRYTIKTQPVSLDVILFCVDVADEDDMVTRVKLKSVCGPGDNCEPVITIMFPDED